jgi:hypothetical protein
VDLMSQSHQLAAICVQDVTQPKKTGDTRIQDLPNNAVAERHPALWPGQRSRLSNSRPYGSAQPALFNTSPPGVGLSTTNSPLANIWQP